MLIFNFWGRMSAKNFFLLQFFISLGKPKFDIISFFLGHLILGESCFYSQWGGGKIICIFFLFSKQTCIFVCTCFLRKPERSLIYIRLILSRSVVCLCTEITRIMRMFLCSNQPWVDVIGSSMPNNWAETSLH